MKSVLHIGIHSYEFDAVTAVCVCRPVFIVIVLACALFVLV